MRVILNGLLIALLFSINPALLSAAESPTNPAGTLRTVTLDVQKMDCPMCKITIRKALEKVNGVKSAKVDYDTKTASVTFAPDQVSVEALIQATRNAGYPSTLNQE